MKNYFILLALLLLPSYALVFSQDSTGSVVIQSKSDIKIKHGKIFKVKNPSRAFWWAVGSTVIPVGVGALIATSGDRHGSGRETREGEGFILIGSGIFFGPSAGNFYARDIKRGIIGILIRAVGAYIVYDANKGWNRWDRIDDEDRTGTGDGYVDQAYLGLGIVAGAAIWNIATAPTSAREYNSKHGLSFSPMYDPLRKTGGMSFTYRF